MVQDSKCIRWMTAPETSPQQLLPATVPAVEGDDTILIRRPFDAWGNKDWFFYWLSESGPEPLECHDPQGRPAMDPCSRV